jgi:hypothetical protein
MTLSVITNVTYGWHHKDFFQSAEDYRSIRVAQSALHNCNLSCSSVCIANATESGGFGNSLQKKHAARLS